VIEEDRAALREALAAAHDREAGTQDALDDALRRVAELESHLEQSEQYRQAAQDERDRWREIANTRDLAEMTRVAWLEHDVRELRAALREAHHTGRQLMGMVDRQTWRDQGGDDGQGHYEGDYYAEKVSGQIESWGTLAEDGGGA